MAESSAPMTPMYRIVIIGTKRSGKRTLLATYADRTASAEQLPRFGSSAPEHRAHQDAQGNVNLNDDQIIRRRRIGSVEVLVTLSVARLENSRSTNAIDAYQWLAQCDAVVVLFDAFNDKKLSTLNELMRLSNTMRSAGIVRQQNASAVLYLVLANKADLCMPGAASLKVQEALPTMKIAAQRAAVSVREEPERAVALLDELLATVVAKRALQPTPSAALLSGGGRAERSPLPLGDCDTTEQRRAEASAGVSNYGSATNGLTMSEAVVVIRSDAPSVIGAANDAASARRRPPLRMHDDVDWEETPACGVDMCVTGQAPVCVLV